MRLSSLLEEKFNLAKHLLSYLKSSGTKYDFHVFSRVEMNRDIPGLYWLSFELTFMGEELLDYDKQIELFGKLFMKEFKRLIDDDRKLWISTTGGRVTFTKAKYAKDLFNGNTPRASIVKEAQSFFDSISFFGQSSSSPKGQYTINILIPESELGDDKP